jgi:tripartite-type tricarboxylate transporter receptor subunit TctC
MKSKPLLVAFFSAALMFACAAVQADTYPSKSVRIVVPYGTGGGSDILARQIGAGLQQVWSQSVVVENRAGASGNIGSAEVVRAPADGYTLLLQNSTMVTNLGMTGKLPYDPANDLTPIMLLGLTPIALAANPSINASNLKELIAVAKTRPESLSYGSCGVGTPQHFVMELVKSRTGIAAVHAGYKGCAPALTDVIGGQIPLAVLSANLVAPYVKNGRLKVIGVSTKERYSLLPEAATFEEQGLKPFDFSIWYALMGPKNLPPTVVAKLVADISKVLSEPAVISNLSNAGVEPLKGTGQDLANLIQTDAKRYAQLAKSANIKAE